MPYEKVHPLGWQDEPAMDTPVDADALDHIEAGIYTASRLNGDRPPMVRDVDGVWPNRAAWLTAAGLEDQTLEWWTTTPGLGVPAGMVDGDILTRPKE